MKHEQSPQTVVDMKQMADAVKELKEKFKPTFLSLVEFQYDFLRNQYLVKIGDPVDTNTQYFAHFAIAVDYAEKCLTRATFIKPPVIMTAEERNRLVEVFNKFLKDRRITSESSPTPIYHTTQLLCDNHTTAPMPPYDGDRKLFMDVLQVHLHMYLLKHSSIMLGSLDNLYHLQDKPWDVIVTELTPILDDLCKPKTT